MEAGGREDGWACRRLGQGDYDHRHRMCHLSVCHYDTRPCHCAAIAGGKGDAKMDEEYCGNDAHAAPAHCCR